LIAVGLSNNDLEKDHSRRTYNHQEPKFLHKELPLGRGLVNTERAPEQTFPASSPDSKLARFAF